jgi:MFS transporter, FSR family, fosmidomycin resistance protein
MPPRDRLPAAVYRLACTHGVIDGYASIYAPLLPLLIPRLGLTLTAAGTLAMLFQLSGSVSQLGFGHLADRWRPMVLVTVGPFISAIVLSLVGLATTPAMLGVILLVGGLGGAAFHPTAAALVDRLGGARRGLAMSVHISGGSIGFAFAPLLFAPFVQRYGLGWTPILALPGIGLLLLFLRGIPPVDLRQGGQTGGLRALRPFFRPLMALYLIVVLRTLTSLSFVTFLPVMLTRRGFSVGEAAAATSLYLFSSGVGGFLGGPLADRFGPKRVIAVSLIVAAPLLMVATGLRGPIFLAVLSCGAIALQSTLPVNVTFAHAIAPVSAGTVSSLMLGFAWGSGGVLVPLVGMAADWMGIEATLRLIAVVPLFAALCTWPLPGGRLTHAPARASDLGMPETA